jgi:hypothetical protein
MPADSSTARARRHFGRGRRLRRAAPAAILRAMRFSFVPFVAFAIAALPACADVIHDAEKGAHTTETEVRGTNGAKSVEQGSKTLQNDIAGHAPADAGADAPVAPAPSAAPASSGADTKI